MNRAGLNGLCVAAGVCLLYMLFDPDMISWRERGPGPASLRTLWGLTRSPPSRPRQPSPAALCPGLQQWAASSRKALAAGALCWGQKRGLATSLRTCFRGHELEPPMHMHCPSPAEAALAQVGTWVTGSLPLTAVFPALRGCAPPTPQRWESGGPEPGDLPKTQARCGGRERQMAGQV